MRRRGGAFVETGGVVAVVTRRRFLEQLGAASGGLLLACVLPSRVASAVGSEAAGLGPWLRIAPDSSTTILVEKVEMGQGIHTALAQIVAEELELDWSRIRVETISLEGASPWIAATVSSTSIRTSWQPLRVAAATARELLVAAAAEDWGVAARACVARAGAVHHEASARSADYGRLVARAAALPVPERVPLKSPGDFHTIGSAPPRLDLPDKVTGAATFGIDVAVDGMLHAAIAMSPRSCGELLHANRAAALAVTGVRKVVEIPDAITVVADHYWQARQGLVALAPEFSPRNPASDSVAYSARLQAALETPGVLAYEQPKGAAPLEEAGARVLRARYEVPFLAHATMEPMNCTASAANGACEIWVSTQSVSRERAAVAKALEIAPERVTVHAMLLGGGFGRRVESDYCVQAALVSRAVGKPVKLIWSREDDIRHDFYRPACAAALEAAVDVSGRPLAVRHHVAGPWSNRELPASLRGAVGWAEKQLGSALAPRSLPDVLWWRLPKVVRDGVDAKVAGAGPPLPYDVARQRREYSLVDCDVRIGWWRSVSASQNAFFSESFIDELAHAAGADPFEYRRGLLRGRGRAVLEQAAELSDWSRARPPGVGLGIAYQALFDSFVCHVAQVRLAAGGQPSVERVWCVVDCGISVSPDALRAQIEGGILFGLSAALRGRISVEQGQVVQSNFHDYPLLSLAETPDIEIALREGGDRPGGAGELATPGIAPAVTNAIFAAGGQRIRSLPILSSS